MMREFEFGQNSKPSQEAELTPEEKTRQIIEEYLKDAELESPKFQAFADFTDRQYAEFFKTQDPKMIDETIRQRINGVKGYKREYEHITRIVLDYISKLANNNMSDEEELNEKLFFFVGLMRTKNQEIDIKSR